MEKKNEAEELLNDLIEGFSVDSLSGELGWIFREDLSVGYCLGRDLESRLIAYKAKRENKKGQRTRSTDEPKN